jgi:geranylgeranylglycerol-phosphate geranylgeranyltransferase
MVGYDQPFQILAALVVTGLISGAGNVTNDYFDYEIDKINKPKRVLPSGKLRRSNAAIYASVLFVLANTVSIAFLNQYMVSLALLNTFITIAYAWRIKRTPFGHFMDSWLASSAFLFGSLFVGINAIIIFLFSMAYLSNLGREIVKGIEDIEGDKKIGAKTLPVTMGKIFASYVAIFFIIFAVMISFLPYFFRLLSMNYLLLAVFSDAIFVFSCFVLLFNPTKSQGIMKIAMFVAIIAFLAGVF